MVKKTEWIFKDKKEIPKDLLEELKKYDYKINQSKKNFFVESDDDSWLISKKKGIIVIKVEHIPSKGDDENDLFYTDDDDYEVEYNSSTVFCCEPSSYYDN